LSANANRIPFAWYLAGWEYGKSDVSRLKKTGDRIGPSEFREEMAGHIFCDECNTPLSRAPKEADVFKNSRHAHFRHKPAYKDVPCSLRTKRGPGFQYESEEELNQAIENESLVIVGGWQAEPPENDVDETDADAVFDQTQLIDKDGPKTDIPLGRHTGKRFQVPSKLTTVLAICRNFDKNLDRGFFFPDSQYATRLEEKLFDTALLTTEPPKESHLFFGRIVSFGRLNRRDKITLRSDEGVTVRVYTWPHQDERKHLDATATGRILLFYASLYTENDGVLACKIDAWGAYSLLPEKYEHCLPD
jgi:hypothetical protein